MKGSGFENKLIARIGKLNAEQIRRFVERILEQKHFLLRVLDRLNEGVIVTDESLNVAFANPKARAMLGLPRQRGQQRENLKEMAPAENPLAETILSLEGSLREIDGYEAAYGRRGDRYVSLTTLLLRSPAAMGSTLDLDDSLETVNGQPLAIILLQDVTERRLRLAEQARAQRLASMATMTSGIAHEIKNPLNSIDIHAQLLKEEAERGATKLRGPDAERVGRAADVIIEESKRLARIVDDFIQAARPRQPDLQERQLAPFIEQAARVLGPECRQAGVAFSVSVEPDLPVIAFDDHMLMQALRNLVRNAIDALTGWRETARGADAEWTPTVEIVATLGAETLDLTVADNGPGIDPMTLEHIFEPYYTTKFQGTGLGLMVVYRIATEHQGALHVRTEPGKGARFTIALPVRQKPVRLLEEAKEPEGT